MIQPWPAEDELGDFDVNLGAEVEDVAPELKAISPEVVLGAEAVDVAPEEKAIFELDDEDGAPKPSSSSSSTTKCSSKIGAESSEAKSMRQGFSFLPRPKISQVGGLLHVLLLLILNLPGLFCFGSLL